MKRGDGTRVDLGDDLLREPVKEPQRNQNRDSSGIGAADLLQNARILMNEGFTDDAKKVLRQILIADSGHVSARNLLDQIHEVELKQIFREEESRRTFRPKAEQSVTAVDSEVLIRQLDQDLGLGVFSDSRPSVSADQLTLFEDPKSLDSFILKIEKDFSNSDLQDWIDLSVAFLEMELYTVAARLLVSTSRVLEKAESDDPESRFSIHCLLAFALILADRPIEAAFRIQPLLIYSYMKVEHKTELFYLMGRTYECMKKMELAVQYYRQVVQLDSHYRDIERRLR